MNRHRVVVKGQPVSFLAGRPPQTQIPPYMGPPQMPFNMTSAPPSFSSQPSPFPPLGGASIPTQAPPSGLGGILQSLLSNKESIGSLLSNAQKVIGVINQVGPIVQNLSPMLHLLKGINTEVDADDSDDILTEIKDEPKPTKPRKRRKRRKRKNQGVSRKRPGFKKR